MKKLLLILTGCLFLNHSVNSQTCFDAGTGADGPYVVSTAVTLPGGTYNFTNLNITSTGYVTVTGTQPLIIHCTGTAVIDGVIDAKGGNGADGITLSAGGAGAIGVAGGANGGSGSFSSGSGPIDGTDGAGTGGTTTAGMGWSGGGGAGYATSGGTSGGIGGFGGAIYGTAAITGLEAGSGGGGGSGGYDCGAGGGGAGGGLILINTGVSISIGATGSINVDGGNGGSDGTGNCGGGGGGSGGSVLLESPSVTNDGAISALGGVGGASAVAGTPYYGTGGNGAVGRIHIGYSGTLGGSGTASPAVGSTTTFAVLAASGTQTNVSCNGSNDGVANVIATGGTPAYSYSWMPSGGTAATATSLMAGTYTCTITDACSSTTQVFTITEPSAIASTQTAVVCSGSSITVGSATHSTSGTFTDVLTSIAGCDSTVTTNLTVNAAITGSQTLMVCAGQSIMVGSATHAVSGIFTDIIPAMNGCDSTVTTNLTVNAPVNVGTMQTGSTLSAAAVGAGYQWMDCSGNAIIAGETNQSYVVMANGDYAVIVTESGCTDTSSCVNMDLTGIVQSGETSQLAVYPNPNTGSFTIKSVSEGTYIIINELGQIVRLFKLEAATNYNETITDLNNGIYFVVGMNNDHQTHQKIIVTK